MTLSVPTFWPFGNQAAVHAEWANRSIWLISAKGTHGKNLYGYQRIYDHQTGVLERVEQAPVVQEAAQLIISPR